MWQRECQWDLFREWCKDSCLATGDGTNWRNFSRVFFLLLSLLSCEDVEENKSHAEHVIISPIARGDISWRLLMSICTQLHALLDIGESEEVRSHSLRNTTVSLRTLWLSSRADAADHTHGWSPWQTRQSTMFSDVIRPLVQLGRFFSCILKQNNEELSIVSRQQCFNAGATSEQSKQL